MIRYRSWDSNEHLSRLGSGFGSISSPRAIGSNSLPSRRRYASSHTQKGNLGEKGDRWGLNPQPLEPQSRALPIELRSPHGTFSRTVSIVDASPDVNSLWRTKLSSYLHFPHFYGTLTSEPRYYPVLIASIISCQQLAEREGAWTQTSLRSLPNHSQPKLRAARHLRRSRQPR